MNLSENLKTAPDIEGTDWPWAVFYHQSGGTPTGVPTDLAG